MKSYTEFAVSKNTTCLESLKYLGNEKSNQTLFILDDDEKLLGTVTDGDIRRGLIKGLKLDSPIHLFCRQNFNYVNEKIDVAYVQKLRKKGIKVLPQLDNNGRIERVFDLTRLKSILPLHAVIMAGGRGERLRPLTDNIPKSMLPLGSKPIIEHNIDRLISFGIEKVTISVRYLSDQIIDYFGDGSSKGISINYVKEDEPLGTIGCISRMESIDHEDLIVLNSDIFTNIDYEEFYLSFRNEKAVMAVASIPYSVDIPYAIMELDKAIIVGFTEKPRNTYYANAGIYLIGKEILNLVPKDTFFNATDLIECVIAQKKKLIHSPITGFWIDIGKHDDYNKAKEIIRHL
jgi:dTDP-glucose pyrophosphorylase